MKGISVTLAFLVCAALGACAADNRYPQVPAPASFGAQPAVAQPPPLEERETRVLPLDAATCGLEDTTLIDVTAAEVLARCDLDEPITRVLLTVVPRTTDPADYLGALLLRFCGDVIDAKGPEGWTVQIAREKGRSGVAADVRWERSPAVSPHRVASGQIGGFAVTLRGQWRRGIGFYIVFNESGGPASGSPHDCPYPGEPNRQEPNRSRP